MKTRNVGLAVFINFVALVLLTSAIECRAEQLQINVDTIACKSKADTVRIAKLLIKQENKEAIGREIANGNCLVLEKGTKVNMGKNSKEWVQVTLPGYNVPVWTFKKFFL